MGDSVTTARSVVHLSILKSAHLAMPSTLRPSCSFVSNVYLL